MYISDPHYIVNQQSPAFAFAPQPPLDTVRLTLDIAGVLGIFGGEEAISAMATVHVYKGRRWLGWYNSPGSYQIAKQYGRVATSKLFKGLFPGSRMDPEEVFELTGQRGPQFQAVQSGTIMESTGHLASIVMKQCAAQPINVEVSRRDGPGIQVSIVDLKEVPPKEKKLRSRSAYSPFIAIIPILASLATCLASAFYEDWISFGLILWGILCNGISCLVIGSGSLRFSHHMSGPGCPPGDGILGSEKQFVLLRGEEDAVNSITRGNFFLYFPRHFWVEGIGYCSLLLLIQFIAQLFLIPLASPFGQTMFITSLVVSWIYNAWLSSFDRDEIQRHILWHDVLCTPSSKKFYASTYTSAIVFMLCVLSPEDPSKILNKYLPNDTRVWKKWKETVLGRLQKNASFQFERTDWNLDGYSETERLLLQTLYRDANAAYEASQRSFQEGHN